MSCRARRRAHLDPNHSPERRTIRPLRRSVRRSDHYAEASDDPTITPKRYTSEASGQPPGLSRIETIYASRRARRRVCVEPSAEAPRASTTPGPSRIEPSAEAQIRRSDTSEPSGKPPGPSRIETIYASRRACRRVCVEPSAEAPRASRRARRQACLDPNHPPKRRERAVGQHAGPVSIQTIRRSATRASRLASRRARLKACAAARAAAHTAPSTERSVEQAVAPEPRAIRHSSYSQRAPQISNRTP